MTDTPKDPSSEASLQPELPFQPFMADIGAVADEVAKGRVVLSLPFVERLTQGNGFLHAGVVATLLDNACGGAAATMMAEGFFPLTAEYKISLMRPASGERLIATATVIKPGRTLTFCEAIGEMERDGKRVLVAKLSATIACVSVGVGA